LCRATARKLNAFQDQIAGKIGAEIQAGVPCPVVMQAVNEAHALAWTTSHPLLFLPDLADEKINLARQWADRQREILDR